MFKFLLVAAAVVFIPIAGASLFMLIAAPAHAQSSLQDPSFFALPSICAANQKGRLVCCDRYDCEPGGRCVLANCRSPADEE